MAQDSPIPDDPDTPRDGVLLDRLLLVMRRLRHSYDRHARDLGLTLSRARALATLARHDGATQAELAQHLAIEAPTLKRQIDALVADGFVERRADPHDARKTALMLTARGRDSAIIDFTNRLRRDLLEGIDPADQAQATAVLERIAQNIERIDRP